MRELTRLREEVGWTQRRLAEESGVNQGAISQIENGRRSPNVETLEKLADAMGREMGDFFPKAQASLWSDNPPERRDIYLPWLEFVNRYADRWEEKIRQGGLNLGVLYEFRDTHYDIAKTTNRLWQEDQSSSSIMTQVVGRQLKLMTTVLEAAEKLFEGSELEQFKKRTREQMEEWSLAANG